MIRKSHFDFLVYVHLSAFNDIQTTCPILVKLDVGSHFDFGVILIVLEGTSRKGLSSIISSSVIGPTSHKTITY
jgi:hypothetical protein